MKLTFENINYIMSVNKNNEVTIMNKTELLLQRLDDIGQSLKDSRQALACWHLVLAE